MAESQEQKLMRILGITADEAQEVVKYDKAVEHNEPTKYDLDPKKEKMAKKFANAGVRKKPIVFDKTPRQRKENPTKASIIAEIAQFLSENSENACENVNITNKERQIAFKIGENGYELTLVQKRKPKK